MFDPNRPLLSAEELLRGWTPARIGRRLVTLAETDSTNAVALASAGQPDADGLAVLADFQNAGRGRLGRTWQAPRGAAILCSVLLVAPSRPGSDAVGPNPPDAEGKNAGRQGTAGWLTLAAAVAACDAIRASTDISPAIKWPNDVRVGGRKVAGILIESQPAGPQARAWVIGIGINCHQHAGHFPPELRESATSLELSSARPIDRVSVARALLQSLDALLGHESAWPAEQIRDHWLAYAEPLGQRVQLRSAGREYAGRTLDMDPTGGLVLQCDDGQQRWFDPMLSSLL